ncbi:hypothetical protein GUITHDRAFT_150228 [Guillardia theta CCMP2712]|uniref:Uncharacterized protein n=1 Tax=Guillardia theta (strain CCMP2712) TaxID=905079 RepID=L1JYD5_GUITC|nr:hypothetical protein GUITHDRAFT_150228 [Guillardia theta CCMP2712]EKX53591.1 hypothetical protein GUITHDRAFT_150228 [Guillardia theta CCMP2712]|eukprot:XP_005840571.1 hypothetical protein GUITHDRAFT_150228 [Guillardia theta CCMP2712]
MDVLPKTVHGVSGRYAGALWLSAAKMEKLPTVESSLDILRQCYEKDETFRLFIKDPSLPRDEKKQTMMSIADQADPLVQDFFGLLCDTGRMNELPRIFEDFAVLMRAHRNEIPVTVTTARNLETDEKELVDEKLEEMKDPDERYLVDMQVDPSIIGGVKIQVGEILIDASVSTAIKDIEKVLSGEFQMQAEEDEEFEEEEGEVEEQA